LSREISRSVVDGTPSSSICMQARCDNMSRHGTRQAAASVYAGPVPHMKSTMPCARACRCAAHPLHLSTYGTHLQARLFERNQLAGRLVLGLVHLTIGALADLLQLLVVVHGCCCCCVVAAGNGYCVRGCAWARLLSRPTRCAHTAAAVC
jgi:hypothetical protein